MAVNLGFLLAFALEPWHDAWLCGERGGFGLACDGVSPLDIAALGHSAEVLVCCVVASLRLRDA